ncbi:MAG: hypothetical protein OXG08_04295 [Gammaproteobacteria bacterium]|nr:hypothetical protein [Gammaproteobacteria bacterium]
MLDTTKEDLKDLLHQTQEGRLQLPDFQRDEHLHRRRRVFGIPKED